MESSLDVGRMTHDSEMDSELLETATMISQLPAELCHHILLDTCLLSTRFCVALSQLSSWTRSLALPYLYQTVIIKKQGPSAIFSKGLSKTPVRAPQADFEPRNYVKSLWLSAVSSRMLSIFAACDKVTHLALHAENLLWLVHASSPSNTAFVMSVLSPDSINGKEDLDLLVIDAKKPDWSLARFVPQNATLASPIFDKVTHLRIGTIGSYSTHLDLAHFKRVTHIAIPYHRPGIHQLPLLLRIFDFPATVFLVVILETDELSEDGYREALNWIVHTRATNPKVHAVVSRLDNLQSDWEEEVRGGLSIWEKAERFTRNLSSSP